MRKASECALCWTLMYVSHYWILITSFTNAPIPGGPQTRNVGWASCPITENGVVRIMTNPAYSKETRFAIEDLILRLNTFASQTDHQFWPDRLSLRNSRVFDSQRLHSSGQLTDIYLLALAAEHKGRLAAFDQTIPASAAAKN